MKHGFVETEADPCVFKSIYQPLLITTSFVDDGLAYSTNKKTLENLIEEIRLEFEICVVPANMYVGLFIERNRSTKQLWIHQGLYIRKILQKIGFS